MRFLFLLLLVLSPAAARAGDIQFNRDVRGILSRNCISCHGPDEEDRQAGLRLDTFEGATEWAIEPGNADDSEVLARILTEDPELRMPPPEHGSALKNDEVELLRQWIEQGAQYEQHWAFQPPKKTPAPQTTGGRVHNEIDAFVLSKLQANGLAQNPPADARSLIRRLSLDLTGLPPAGLEPSTQALMDDYLAEPTQEKLSSLVDEMLSSNAYAEHWASVWLDIARYADTVGYSGDEQRDIWPWRDWLIRAIADNKSYEELSIEMLAGDLLADATDEQKLATAFHRNTLLNNEGGTDDEEFRTIAVKDRLSTTINAWMGLTVRCAECHSHKYDPISQHEYYSLLAIFNQTADSDKKDERPKLAVRPSADPRIVAELNRKIEDLESKMAAQAGVWQLRQPVEMASESGTEFEQLDDGSILAKGPRPAIESYYFTFEIPVGESVAALRLETLPDSTHLDSVGRGGEGAFILSQVKLFQLNNESDETGEELAEEIEIEFNDAADDYHQPNHAAKTAIREEVKSGARQQGWAVNHPVSGYKDRHEAIFQLAQPISATEAPVRIKFMMRFDPPWPGLNIGRPRVSTTAVENAAEKYRKKQLDPVRREIEQLVAQRDTPVRVPVMKDLPANKRRDTFVMLRGNFRSPGDQVKAGFPEAFDFDDTDSDGIPNRLDLARWLFDAENPLTARVAVNRYWARLMGMGIVETEEDFGTQGLPPSHRRLLDHLAVDFREHGWDVKYLLKKIVMSATYQQSPNVDAESIDIDPRNKLLSRGPRVRLTAEVVRDQALAVSGLLSDKMFGPPVYPPSPIKRVVNAFTGGMTWVESTGDDRYRRALYTYLKRSAPHPLFETFDMASRDVCSMRRLRTNTPLQSFMTLNDITFIEAARSLAKNTLPADSDEILTPRQARTAISVALETALYQEPDAEQIQVLSKLYAGLVEKYSADLGAAAKLTGATDFDPDDVSSAERDRLVNHAAMTVVGNVILNLDRFLNN